MSKQIEESLERFVSMWKKHPVRSRYVISLSKIDGIVIFISNRSNSIDISSRCHGIETVVGLSEEEITNLLDSYYYTYILEHDF